MEIKINNEKFNDSYVFQANNIQEAREIAASENNKRGWKDDDCYSEIINEEQDNE